MEVRLDNIGIIKDSTIDLEGLTVITGRNNSGKTTVGKALYAILSAVEDLQLHAFEDKKDYALSRCRDSVRRLGLNLYDIEGRNAKDNFANLYALLAHLPWLIFDELTDMNALTGFMDDVTAEIKKMTAEDFTELTASEEDGEPQADATGEFTDNKERVLAELKKLRAVLLSDPELIEYACARINGSLKLEFNEQILPVAGQGETGTIILQNRSEKLYQSGKLFYRIKIRNNQIDTDDSGRRVFFGSPYEKVIFLDDVYVLDSIGDAGRKRRRLLPIRSGRDALSVSFDDILTTCGHNQHLLDKLGKRQDNLFEELVNAKNAKSVLERINAVFPEEVIRVDGKYVCSGSKLDVRNLAAGSKMFAIIKLLLEKGELDAQTLLILDEPESHLHPEWQNSFAEAIVLLVRYLETDVLLTTHSPNFLMAIEAFSKKYELWDRTNVYMTEQRADSHRVQYRNVKNRVQEAYAKLANPLFEIQRELDSLEES